MKNEYVFDLVANQHGHWAAYALVVKGDELTEAEAFNAWVVENEILVDSQDEEQLYTSWTKGRQ